MQNEERGDSVLRQPITQEVFIHTVDIIITKPPTKSRLKIEIRLILQLLMPYFVLYSIQLVCFVVVEVSGRNNDELSRYL